MNPRVIKLLAQMVRRGAPTPQVTRTLLFGPAPQRMEPTLYSVETRGPWKADWVDEAPGCKALLLEIVRRASFDWVLYQSSTRLQQKKLAEEAYTWLFQEQPGHRDWEERSQEGKHLVSFLGICEALDLEPDLVRRHIRRLTPKHVQSIGRPPERSHSPIEDRVGVNVAVDGLFSTDSESLDDVGGFGFSSRY